MARVKNTRRNKKHVNVAAKHGLKRVIEFQITGPCNMIWPVLCAWEIGAIAAYKTFQPDNPDGIGCNFTRGGEGIRGFSREKSAKTNAAISAGKRAQYADPKERKKTSIAVKRAKSMPLAALNASVGQKKRYADPAERQRAHDTNTQKRTVQQLTKDWDVIAEFTSLSYAMQATGVLNIKLCCRGKRQFAGGYRWRYV
jgi:hypothetical protein